jgi:uncharacterized protein YndB with AHSA1/START domain
LVIVSHAPAGPRDSTPVHLPYVDEHTRTLDVPPERVWRALLATLQRSLPNVPGWIAAVWGLEQSAPPGEQASTIVGDSLPGFVATTVEPARLLTLRGRHRFSEYELRFELESSSSSDTRLRATTFASFDGLKGRAYRALVIGTGGHRIAVRRMLASVARRVDT